MWKFELSAYCAAQVRKESRRSFFVGFHVPEDEANEIVPMLQPVLKSHKFLDAEQFATRVAGDAALKKRRLNQSDSLTGWERIHTVREIGVRCARKVIGFV